MFNLLMYLKTHHVKEHWDIEGTNYLFLDLLKLLLHLHCFKLFYFKKVAAIVIYSQISFVIFSLQLAVKIDDKRMLYGNGSSSSTCKFL